MNHRPATHAALAAVIGLVITTAGCGSSDSDDSGKASPQSPPPAASTAAPSVGPTADISAVRHLTAQEFAEAIKQPGVVVIDVRTPAEYAEGHIAGARNVDVQSGTFMQQIGQLDKTASYAVYCRSGKRSATAGAMMLSSGFTKVVGLAGGVLSWTAAGNQLSTS